MINIFNRKYLLLVLLVIGLAFLTSFISPPKASAAPPVPWNAGRIIDDSVFFNRNTMSAQDIQNFLSAKVPVCDTNHAPYTSPNSGVTYSPPFTCIKDYAANVPSMAADAYCGAINGGSMSAATIIKTVSQACGINPQVLIVLLQKEQGLITDTWPINPQYQFATGFCVYDDPATEPPSCQGTDGFFNQVYYGARQFQKYVKQPQSFIYRVGLSSFVAYAPDGSCGGSNVYMQNGATAALYNYTPYQPNQAAINAGLGTAPCGAYGNRNFWLYFWSWFGNTTGPDYAWSIDTFSYSPTMGVGQTQTMTLKATNTGRLPWYNQIAAPSTPTRVGTWTAGRASPFQAGSWLNSIRPANMTENYVPPGADGTFTFQVTAPNTTGTYVEPFNLLMENYLWLPWAGLSPTIEVVPAYHWKISDVIYGNGTGYLEPGTTQLITVKSLNDGTATWDKSSGPQIRLGTWAPGRVSPVADSGWISNIRAVTMNENTVAPGQVAGFQFYVRVPTSGMYYERFNLVAEGQTWFNDAGLTLYLQGTNYSWQPLGWTFSTPSADIPHGQKFTITVTAKNTGQTIWRQAGQYPIRLGTIDPINRGSALEDSSWFSSIRPAGLQEATVAPGGTGTFIFTATSPPVPGWRLEDFNLVAEGLQWLNNPGIHIYVNSL